MCIRCSGIHRGMGTHISRVKSVDLDAWTDDQLQSVLKWGNTRANKYWEAKLAIGHAPSEAKIENFIRTKYESKRWVMDGPMPDPSTLDADDDVPLNIVQEKAKIERSASQRLQGSQKPPSQPRPVANVDLFGDFDPPARPATTDPPKSTRTAPPPAQTKPARPQESLMGLDFFGNAPAAGVGRPSSAASNPSAANPRGDLKNSILSLYASAPKPQPASQPTQDRQLSFGGIAPESQSKDAFGGLADAFGGLGFPSSTSTAKSPPVQSPPSGFSGLSFPTAMPAKATPSAPQVTSPPPLSGGNFFDVTPKSLPMQPPAKPAPRQASGGLDFSFAQKPIAPSVPAAAPAPVPAPKPAANIPADTFSNDDFGGWASTTSPTTTAPPPPMAVTRVTSPTTMPSNDFGSAFNLSSQPAPKPAPAPVNRAPAPSQPGNPMFDPWSSAGDSSPWGAPDPTPASGPKKASALSVDLGKPPEKITPNDISGGWGAPISSAGKAAKQASVTADEDFGGWTSASTNQTPVAPNPPKQGGGFGTGFGTGSDPFDNPW